MLRNVLVPDCTWIHVTISMYVQREQNETAQTSYETSQCLPKSGWNGSFGKVEEASAVPAGGVRWHVQAGEKASDAAVGRRPAGVVSTGRAGVPDADQPDSASSDDRGEKEGAGVSANAGRLGWRSTRNFWPCCTPRVNGENHDSPMIPRMEPRPDLPDTGKATSC